MKRMLVFLKGYTKESILAPAFKMLEAFFDLLVPLVVADIIDIGIAQGDSSYVIKRVMLLILLALVGLVCSITAQYFSAKASVGFAAGLRQALFDHIQDLSFSKTDTLGTSTLITRLTSDVNQAQNGVNMGLRLLLRSPFIVFGSMIMAFTIDVRCALVFAAAIPVLSVVVYGIMIITIPLYRKVQSRLDVVTGMTRENLTGGRVIRAFCKEPDQVRDYDRSNTELTRMNEFVGRIASLMNPLTYVLINLATIFLIRQGAVRVNLGSLQQGDVVALYNYMAQMIVELVKLASLIITINRAVACMGRVSKILDTDTGMSYPEVKVPAVAQNTTDQEQKGSVRFEQVTFTYEGAGAPSLTDIDFEAAPGQTIGIIGGTGSGKTSLVDLIPRFYDADKGAVYVDGQDVKAYPKGELISRIGVGPQKAMLFSGTVRENLLWGNPGASDEALWDAIRTAQAEEVVRGKEGGLDSRIEQNGRNLSGGQRQRLTIARALVKKPEILILDDSASALDFATDAALRKAIQTMEGNATVFIVSQRASSIMQADCILVLDDGMLVGKGTHAELMRDCAVYQEIYYSQFPEQKPVEKEVPSV